MQRQPGNANGRAAALRAVGAAQHAPRREQEGVYDEPFSPSGKVRKACDDYNQHQTLAKQAEKDSKRAEETHDVARRVREEQRQAEVEASDALLAKQQRLESARAMSAQYDRSHGNAVVEKREVHVGPLKIGMSNGDARNRAFDDAETRLLVVSDEKEAPSQDEKRRTQQRYQRELDVQRAAKSQSASGGRGNAPDGNPYRSPERQHELLVREHQSRGNMRLSNPGRAGKSDQEGNVSPQVERWLEDTQRQERMMQDFRSFEEDLHALGIHFEATDRVLRAK